MKRLIVELEPGVWLAPWKGDPGRTTVIHSAKQFHSLTWAARSLAAARRYSPFRDARVVEVRVTVEEKS